MSRLPNRPTVWVLTETNSEGPCVGVRVFATKAAAEQALATTLADWREEGLEVEELDDEYGHRWLENTDGLRLVLDLGRNERGSVSRRLATLVVAAAALVATTPNQHTEPPSRCIPNQAVDYQPGGRWVSQAGTTLAMVDAEDDLDWC